MGLNNFFMAVKKKIETEPLRNFSQTLAKVHCASSAIYLRGIG